MNACRRIAVSFVLCLLAVPAALAQDAGVPAGSRDRAGEEVRFGSPYELFEGQRTEDVVVMGAAARISGTVRGDVVVIGGPLELGGSAVVNGDTVVVGGSVTVSEGATVRGDLVVVMASYDAPADFSPGGELVVVSGSASAPFAAVWQWIEEGPLMGRLIVPGIMWFWFLIALAGLVACGVTLVFERPVRDCSAALAAKPITSFLVGGLVTLLLGPVTLLLLVSVIGIPIVPFVWVALLLAAIVGNVGVARWIGARVYAEESLGDRLQALRSVAIGFGILCLAFMIPVLGLATPILLAPLALGSATMVCYTGLRRERGSSGGNDGESNPDPSPPASAAAPPPAARTDASEGSGNDAGLALPPAKVAAAELNLAGFRRRVAAGALDFIPMICLGAAAGVGGRLTLLVFLVYCVAMWILRSSTVGGMVCRIRVIRLDGGPIAPSDAVVRGLASVFSFAFLGLGWLWAAWDERKQAWHDRAAGTIVVYEGAGTAAA
ncbi:MAG: RDD family protein [Bryobacterales bacterium]|nr:RDD family protein [Bryobacterales bacterium]